MKLLMIAILMAATTFVHGQTVDLNKIPTGAKEKVTIADEYGRPAGEILVNRLDQRRTSLSFDFSKSGKKNFLLEIIKNNTIVHKEQKGGPNGDIELMEEPEVLDSWVITENSPEWWWGILLVGYCCLELSLSHTSNSDGTESFTATVGFDCDCFTIGGGLVSVEDGTEFAGVTSIRLTPLN